MHAPRASLLFATAWSSVIKEWPLFVKHLCKGSLLDRQDRSFKHLVAFSLVIFATS